MVTAMTKIIDDGLNLILGAILATNTLTTTALYRDADAPLGLDIGGDEFAVNPYRGRPMVKSPLAADFADADTSNWSSAPRPAVTAYDGFDGDAFWFDPQANAWVHCQTGEPWSC